MSSPKTPLKEGADRLRNFYPHWYQWLIAGFQRYPIGSTTALLLGWTGVVFAVYVGIGGFFVGAVVFLLIRVFHVAGVTEFLNSTPANANIFFALIAGVLGAGASFVYFYVATTLDNLGQTFVSLVVGMVLAVAVVLSIGLFEETILRLQGYRRLSIDENRRISPLAQAAGDAMHLGALPRFAISDKRGRPDACMGLRTLMLSRGLYELLDDRQLKAVIAHELAHWKRADSVGRSFIVWAGWPLVFWFQVGAWMARTKDPFEGVQFQVGKMVPKSLASSGGDSQRDGGLGGDVLGQIGNQASSMFGQGTISAAGFFPLIGKLIAFPCVLLVNWVLNPLVSKELRRSEFAADALVKDAGLGPDLAKALATIQFFELGGIGISRKLAETHPPIGLRIERLQNPRADDASFLEPELGYRELRVLAKVAPFLLSAVVLLAAASVYAHSGLPASNDIPLFSSSTPQGQLVSNGHTSNPVVTSPPIPTVTVTATPVPTLSGLAANITVSVLTPQWQAGILGGPATVHFQVTVVNQSADDALAVAIKVIGKGQPVPIFSQDEVTSCAPDNTTDTQIDIADLAAGASQLCEPVVKAAVLGTSPFYFAVYANGNTTQPSVSAKFVCASQFGGETCSTA